MYCNRLGACWRAVIIFIMLVLVGIMPTRAEDFMSRKVFQAAMSAFKERSYYSARLLLQEIIHKDHTGEFADDAQYYLALTYYYEEDYNSALFELKVFLRDYTISEYSASVEYWIGECYYYLKDYRNALQSHYDFIKKYPDDKHTPYAYYSIGYIYNVLKRYDDAVAEFEKALDMFPASKMAPKIALQLGISHYNNGEFSQARKQFQQMLMTMDDSIELENASLWIGKSWYAEKKYPEAQKQFQAILEKYPDKSIAADATYHLALTSYRLDKLDESLGYLDKILTLYPDWSEIGSVFFRKGQILQMKKQFAEAANNYHILVDGHPESEFYSQALELLADCYQQTGETNKALQIYDKILEGFSVDSESEIVILQKKGNLLFQMGDFRKSAMAYERLYEKFPASSIAPEALYMRAQSHFKGQMYNVALDILQNLETKYPKSKWKTDAYFLEGEVYYALTDYTKALQSYNKIIRFYPKHTRYFDSLMGVGWSYFELKQYARASDWFRRAQGSAGTDVQKSNVLLATASCMYNLRGFEEALKYYKITIDTYPKEEAAEESQFQIAWVHYRQNDFQKAFDSFNDYLMKYADGKRHIEAAYFKAWSLYRQEKYNDALPILLDTYEKTPAGNVFREKSLLDYAKTLSVVKKHNEAIASYKKFLKEFPESNSIEETYYSLSNSLLEVKNTFAVEQLYNDLKILKPNSLYLNEILKNLGAYYRKFGHYSTADRIYKMIIENTENPEQKLETAFQRIRMYSEASNYEEALSIARELLKGNSEEYAPYYLKIITEIIQLMVNSGKTQDALNLIQDEKNKKTQDKTFISQIEFQEAKIYLIRKEYEKSREILKNLMNIKELSIGARYYTALTYYETENFAEASEFFKQVVQKTEEEYFAAWSFYYLGEIQFIKQDFLTAAREYTKIVYLYSGNHDLYEKALFKAALCFKKAGKPDEFTTYRDKLRESFPESKYLGEL